MHWCLHLWIIDNPHGIVWIPVYLHNVFTMDFMEVLYSLMYVSFFLLSENMQNVGEAILNVRKKCNRWKWAAGLWELLSKSIQSVVNRGSNRACQEEQLCDGLLCAMLAKFLNPLNLVTSNTKMLTWITWSQGVFQLCKSVHLSIYFVLMSFSHGILLKAFSLFFKQRLFQVFPPPPTPSSLSSSPLSSLPPPSFSFLLLCQICRDSRNDDCFQDV